jgi:hypothetical protein
VACPTRIEWLFQVRYPFETVREFRSPRLDERVKHDTWKAREDKWKNSWKAY